jgi:hypothetical protein
VLNFFSANSSLNVFALASAMWAWRTIMLISWASGMPWPGAAPFTPPIPHGFSHLGSAVSLDDIDFWIVGADEVLGNVSRLR